MFCTAACLESAYKRFHRLECKIIGHIQHFGIKDSAWLAIRMLMVASNQGRTLETMMKHSIFGNPMIKETNVLPRMDLETYAHIHNLEDHVEERRFDYPNGLMAALLLHILKHSSFFGFTKNVSQHLKYEKQLRKMIVYIFRLQKIMLVFISKNRSVI